MSIIASFPQGGGGGVGVPTGIIAMWSGAADAIPEGWALCNGSNGTPDLRGRFMLGAGGSYAVGAKGGEAAHRLSVSEMPGHSHGSGNLSASLSGDHTHSLSSLSISSSGAHTHDVVYVNSVTQTGRTQSVIKFYDERVIGTTNISGCVSSGGAHTHTVSGSVASSGSHTHAVSGSIGSAGGSTAHNNMPPYYALCYIMKL